MHAPTSRASLLLMDDASSLRLKYDWATSNWGGFRYLDGRHGRGREWYGVDSGSDAGRALWDAIPSPCHT
jgi:hypothetical protein